MVLRKSNKWNATADVLKVEARKWALRETERPKRPYKKANDNYWGNELLEVRKKKRKALSALVLTDEPRPVN